MTRKRLFLITGDASGDVHAGYLIRRLQELMPSLEIGAIGGEKVKSTGVEVFCSQQRLGVFGLGVFGAFPSHYFLGKRLLTHFRSWRPDAVLLIDYGMFNLWMARQLKGLGIKVFYYIPPQVWASRQGRLKTIQRYVDHVFSIFPFEKPLYDRCGIPTTFVGHPLVEQLPDPPNRLSFCREHNLNPDLPIIGIFPGSRRSEVKALMKTMIEAIPLILRDSGQSFQFLLARSPAIPEDLFNRIYESLKPITDTVPFAILTHQNHQILALSQAAMVASGTVTLEAALYRTPVVISYKLSRFAFELFKHFVYVRHIGLPNLLSRNPNGFLPELLMEQVTPEGFSKAICPYLSDTPLRREAESEFAFIGQQLGQEAASLNLVKELATLLNQPLQENALARAGR